jgi:hypothetical protein
MLIYLVIGLAYILLSMFAGHVGRKRRIGYWGFFFVSIILTPIISILFIYFATPKRFDKVMNVQKV